MELVKYICVDCPEDVVHRQKRTKGRRKSRCPEHLLTHKKAYHRAYDAQPEQKFRRKEYMRRQREQEKHDG